MVWVQCSMDVFVVDAPARCVLLDTGGEGSTCLAAVVFCETWHPLPSASMIAMICLADQPYVVLARQ